VQLRNPHHLFVQWVLCPLLLALFPVLLAFGQAGRGGISGTITDPSGAVVPGAKVTALNRATGIKQQSVSSAAGLYSFVSLNPGTYEITASQTGFESVAQENVTVNVDQVVAVNIGLQVGKASDVVTVTDTTALQETSSSTVGQLL